MNSPKVTSCCAGLYELPLTELLLGSSFHPGGIALTDRLAQAVALGPEDRVLDLASGRGETAFHLARRYGSQVVGIDYSQTQVEEANLRVEEEDHLSNRLEFLTADAHALPISSHQFDVVFCECALCTFPDQHKALSEVRRVLAPGGFLALSDVVLNAPVPAELAGLFGVALCVGGALSRDGYQGALEEGGFENIRFRNEDQCLHRLVDQVESRLAKMGDTGAFQKETELSFDEIKKVLQAARQFVHDGGLGYATFTARSPRRKEAYQPAGLAPSNM